MEEQTRSSPAEHPASSGAPDFGPEPISHRIERILLQWDHYRQRPAVVGVVVAVCAGLLAMALWSATRTTPTPVEELIPNVALTPTTPPAAQAPSVVVHVAGEVRTPGVYELPAGSRILDAVAAAGGVTRDADPNLMNLAATVVDGVQIRVPAEGDAADSSLFGVPTNPGLPVDLNTATAEQLEQLPGIGPATAAGIVAFRDENGPFTSAEALLGVPGIGPAKLERLIDEVRVG